MDKQKEIEKMATILGCDLCNGDRNFSCENICDKLKEAKRQATALINAGYRLCGGDNCPNYKHYQAECERCTKKMEIKKALEIDAIKQQAVREFAERLKEIISLMTMERDAEYKDGYNDAIKEIIAEIDKLVKEVCGE